MHIYLVRSMYVREQVAMQTIRAIQLNEQIFLLVFLCSIS